MELLNNIWNAISTPNEGLINIISIPANFIEVTFSLFLFSNLLNISSTFNKKLIHICICALGSIATFFILPSPLNTFVNIIITYIAVYVIFHLSHLKTLFAVICPAIVSTLIGTLISNPYITILKISATDVIHIPIYRLGYLLATYIFYLIIVLILKNKNLKINLLDKLDKKNTYIIYSNLIFGIITLIIQAIITTDYMDKLPISITFLSFLSLLAYFGISIYSLTRIMKLTLTTQKLENAEAYNKTLHILHDSVRSFKHDFDNIVTTIGGYIKTNDMDGLKKYYIQLEEDCQKVNNLYLLNPEIINNPRYI